MINIKYIFPTGLGYDINVDLANSVLPIAHEYIGVYGKKHTGDMHITTYNNHQCVNAMISDVRLNNVYEYVFTEAVNFLTNQNVDTSKIIVNRNISAFFAKISKGAEHQLHAHPYSLLSGCFYLDVDEDSSPIIFQDPRPYNQFVFYPLVDERKSNVETFYPEVVVKPETGLLLLWPSWLEHQVLKSTSEKDRIAMVFDINNI